MSRKRSNKIYEQVLELLAGGTLVTEVCRDLDISPGTLNRWRRSDTDFDDRCWSAEAQGIMIQRSELIESMKDAIEMSGPGSSTRIQGLHNLLHENGRTAGRLVARMNDRISVSSNVEYVIVGWQESNGDVINIGPEAHLPSNNSRQYLDASKRSDNPLAATASEGQANG
tara:strand:- start:58 stop:567 length:510 start_codon:yes stop_codon:yes gene_type:complete